MQKLGADGLIGNMPAVRGYKSPLDPDFLIRIRKEPIYLLDEVLASCQNIEKWVAEYKNQNKCLNQSN